MHVPGYLASAVGPVIFLPRPTGNCCTRNTQSGPEMLFTRFSLLIMSGPRLTIPCSHTAFSSLYEAESPPVTPTALQTREFLSTWADPVTQNIASQLSKGRREGRRENPKRILRVRRSSQRIALAGSSALVPTQQHTVGYRKHLPVSLTFWSFKAGVC